MQEGAMVDRFSLDEIKDLFRDDVVRFLDGMRGELERLNADPCDSAALDRLRGLGHSLKGSAGLVGLTYLSQSGAVVDRLAEVAGGLLESDAAEAVAIYQQLQAALPLLDELLDN